MNDVFDTLLDGLFATELLSLDLRPVLPLRMDHNRPCLLGIWPPRKGYRQQIYDLNVVGKLFLGNASVPGVGELFDMQYWWYISTRFIAVQNNMIQFVDGDLVQTPLYFIGGESSCQFGVGGNESRYSLPIGQIQAISKKGARCEKARKRLMGKRAEKELDRMRAAFLRDGGSPLTEIFPGVSKREFMNE